MKRVLTILTTIVVTIGSAMPLAAQTMQQDPYNILARARSAWSTQHYPEYLSYTIAVHVSEHGVDKAKHYHLDYDALRDSINVNAVSDEEAAAPVVATGFTLHLRPLRQGHAILDKKVGNPGEAVDYLGVPKLAPTYSFGVSSAVNAEAAGRDTTARDDALIAQIRSEFHDPMPEDRATDPSARGKLTIASVTSRSRAYIVRLDGIESIDGHDCYHLLLQPNGNPRRLRLRELWVDTQTFETRRLVSAGNFTSSNVPWLISFCDVDGKPYISSEIALAPVAVGEHRYEHASLSFESIQPADHPQRMQSWFLTSQNIMTEPQQ